MIQKLLEKPSFWLRGALPQAQMWRATLLFVAVDCFFTGLVGAFAFLQGNVLAVLLFLVGQQLMTVTGQALSNWLASLHDVATPVLMRAGTLMLAGILATAGSGALAGVPLLVFLSLGGGLARGLTYGSRLWLEFHLKDVSVRQSYLSAVEAASVVLKLLAPVWALVVLGYFSPRVEMIFLSAGIFFLGLGLVMPLPTWDTAKPSFVRPFQLIRQPSFWTKAEFHALDGAGHALRMALFVSGAMAVVGSIKSYALVECFAGVLAAGLLVKQAHSPSSGPSLAKLKQYLSLLGLTWLCLMLALWLPVALPLFVVGYVLVTPLVAVQKTGVALSSFGKSHANAESAILARSILQSGSRVGVLSLFALLYAWLGVSQSTLLLSMAAAAIALLPLEYLTAKRLHLS